MHIGHFGNNARPAAGTIHPAALRSRAGAEADAPIGSRSGSLETTPQHP